MISLKIVTDLDCKIVNLSMSPILRCGINNIARPCINQLILRPIEYPTLMVVKNISQNDSILSVDFTSQIRNTKKQIKGNAKIKNKSWDLYGLYDLVNGKEILPTEYREVGDVGRWMFDAPYLEIQDCEKAKYGIVNAKGEEVFACQFMKIGNITKDGLACVETQNGRTFVNAVDGLIFPVRNNYYRGYGFEEGLLQIVQNQKIGYINQYGQTVIPPIFDIDRNDILIGFANGYRWEKMNGKWGIIDVLGNITCDFIFDKPGSNFDINKVSTL